MSLNPPRKIPNTKISYRALLGESQWHKLHPLVQKRFGDDQNKAVVYQGVMSEIYLSTMGKLFAQVCRLIGQPLALYEGMNVPMKVHVYENSILGGMTWDRFYQYQNKPVNRVKSTKVIQANGVLVEVVGCGFGMKLNPSESAGAIVFESDYFFLQLGKKRIKIPDWLTPGKMTVSQRALSDEWFEFKLDVTHKLLGRTYYQIGQFSESQ
ncbi:DUF4166 domain-containing protein [Aliikangiella marina]|uniref:DUF4166 domain-containing protein n=1 Tax=Aliikangiella marina TaxID=1712262 RepID=A0A545T4H5_9GAMM|nr:DUF4166 domain-containing protein [Aliikangiella marina]TQV72121.1 DUF4166 domain-containing protein [Aliikangiella marina]